MNSEIIVVSGLPRSGTSLMMQMLDRGGIDVLTDVIRQPDIDNPQGYYEFERVKKLKEDASWIPEARGKAVKIVSQLLYDLPSSEKYRVIFMERLSRRSCFRRKKFSRVLTVLPCAVTRSRARLCGISSICAVGSISSRISPSSMSAIAN